MFSFTFEQSFMYDLKNIAKASLVTFIITHERIFIYTFLKNYHNFLAGITESKLFTSHYAKHKI